MNFIRSLGVWLWLPVVLCCLIGFGLYEVERRLGFTVGDFDQHFKYLGLILAFIMLILTLVRANPFSKDGGKLGFHFFLSFLFNAGAVCGWVLINVISTPEKNDYRGGMSLKQLTEYVRCFEQFEREYGQYPDFINLNGEDVEWVIQDVSTSGMFIVTMGASNFNGKKMYEYGNVRGIEFFNFTGEEFDQQSGRMRDYLGNNEFHFLFDGDGDGRISSHLNGLVEGYDIPGRVVAYSVGATKPDLEVFTWDPDGMVEQVGD